MKNYKILVPIALIVIFLLSFYVLISQRIETNNRYEEALGMARTLRSEEIYTDAEKKYFEALKIKNTKELNLELAEFYVEAGLDRKALNHGALIIDKYPHDPIGYEFMISLYKDKKDFTACWITYEKMKKLKVSSDKVEEIMASIEYEFFFNCEFDDVTVFSSGLCPVCVEDKWGYVNENGGLQIPAKYVDVNAFSPVETAGVNDPIKNEIYFIDKDGNKKNSVPIKNVQKVGFKEDDVFSAFSNNSWSFYRLDYRAEDESGVKVAVADELFGGFTDASSLGNGMAACMKDSRWYLYDAEGNKITDKAFDDVVVDEKGLVFRNDRVFVQNGATYAMLDGSGNVVADGFTDARLFNDDTYAAVKKNDKWGFIDKDGNMVIDYQYDDARSFSNGFAAVEMDGKWGFINEDNTIVIDPQFYDAKDFNSSGAVFVKNGQLWQLLRLYKMNHKG